MGDNVYKEFYPFLIQKIKEHQARSWNGLFGYYFQFPIRLKPFIKFLRDKMPLPRTNVKDVYVKQ